LDGEICDIFPMTSCHPHHFPYRLFQVFQPFHLFHLFQTRCREIWNSFPDAFQGVDAPPEPVLGLAFGRTWGRTRGRTMTGGRGRAHG